MGPASRIPRKQIGFSFVGGPTTSGCGIMHTGAVGIPCFGCRRPFARANVYAALKPGSPLYVVGWILDDSRTSPLSYATYNLIFVNDYIDGLIRTRSEEHTSELQSL